MARFRCNACDGEFDDVSADGVRYFHACPSERVLPIVGKQPIANKVDQNLAPGAKGGEGTVKSAGAGVTKL